jgi:dihydropteroate synthase
VSAEDELARVVPVIRRLRRETGGPISVDTYKANVARAAVEAGAAIVNDISGLRFDPEMVDTVARTGAACVAMHILGEPKTMQEAPRYDDLIGEVKAYLAESVALARGKGIEPERIAVDPGIGFGKTFDHNLTILRRLDEFADLGCAVLVGPSRKAFLGKILGGAPPAGRLPGTAAAVACAIAAGADVVRVHDVAFMVGVAKAASAIRRGRVSEADDGA